MLHPLANAATVAGAEITRALEVDGIPPAARPAIDLGWLDAEDVDLLQDALIWYRPGPAQFVPEGAHAEFVTHRARLLTFLAARLALAARPEVSV